MIKSLHTMIYSDDPEATRTFLRDVLEWPYVSMTDEEMGGNAWLIFKSGPSEMGVHPTRGEWEGRTYEHPRHHSLSLMCDDIQETVASLQGKGAQFRGEIEDHGYGLVIQMVLPGAGDIQLYEPRHPEAHSL